MLVDARALPEGERLSAPVCVVGGGVAGIALTLTLARAGVDVVLVESGGLAADAETDDLSDVVDEVGDGTAYDRRARSRFLGGSSNCWGGWNRPLEAEDFAARSWVPHSGWPLDRAELQPWYDRSHDLLTLGPTTFDAEFWGAAIAGPRVHRAAFTNGLVHDSFSQFTRDLRLGRTHRDELETHPGTRVLLHGTVTDLVRRPDGGVGEVEVRTLTGRRVSVAAAYVVLAAGGVENPRLLLTADGGRGIGNEHDQVGRCFMDHPRVLAGHVRLRPAYRRNRLYDIRHQDRDRAPEAHGVRVAAGLVLDPAVVAREGLLHARVGMRSVLLGEDSDAVAALQDWRRLARQRRSPSISALGPALRRPDVALGYTLARSFPQGPLRRDLRLEVITEPEPDPANRVTLHADRDALGVPRARVRWQIGELTRRTIDRTLALVAAELGTAGVADVDLRGTGSWADTAIGTWHHMGATRMATAPTEGVVDRDCRVHGSPNLYVAGSSVFPTAGANFPTMTLTALALRLAEHLHTQVRTTA